MVGMASGCESVYHRPEIYPYSSLQKNAFSADLGLMVRLYSNWKVGFSAENIIPANVGLTTTEDVPAIFRLGAAYDLYLGSAYADSLLSTLEVTERNQEYTPKVGLESWHFHRSVASGPEPIRMISVAG